MTESENHTVRNAWMNVVEFIEFSLQRKTYSGTVADQVQRLINENSDRSLVAKAVADAFDKDSMHLEFRDLAKIQYQAPVLGWDHNGIPFLIIGRSFGRRYRIVNVTGNQNPITMRRSELKKRFAEGAQFRDRIVLDAWNVDAAHVRPESWFRESVQPLKRSAKHVVIAALFGNLLAVCVSLYALQVWDRVIPAQSMNSLTVLLIGVVIAITFEFILRQQRVGLIDSVGIQVDRSISNTVFAQMLNMHSDARPQSLGVLAAQLREINQIREAVSSTMLSAAVDVPFSLVFVVIIFSINSTVAIPIVIAIGIIVLVNVMSQLPLAKLAQEGLEESTVRNGMIVESVTKADELKLLQAEQTLLLRWDRVVEVASAVANKQRAWRNFLSGMTTSMQQLAYALVVSVGAYSVIQGELTMGQVIACSILTNRAISPFAMLSSVMSTMQGSILAKRSIDQMMQQPSEAPTKDHVRRELKAPAIRLKNVRYNYPTTTRDALIVPRLDIPFGSKIGILGKVGSGKSTLLRLFSGLSHATQGTLTLDATDIRSIHRDDVRRTIGFQSQSASLLRGTVRENLLIAKPSATEAEMVEACEVSGAASLVIESSLGLDLMINESGDGLSGGQRQSLFLARTLLRDPKIVLFDEPTASMDQQSEIAFIQAMKKWSEKRTLVLATHRMPPLDLCDHLLVVNEGRIVMNDTKAAVLEQLRSNGAST